MVCASCGAEVPSGKRFCPKCGMPMVDYKVKAKEDEVLSLKDLGKRINELRPEVEEYERKKEEEKEKKRKEKEEREAALCRALAEDEDEEEEELLGAYGEPEEEEEAEEDDEEEAEEELDPEAEEEPELEESDDCMEEEELSPAGSACSATEEDRDGSKDVTIAFDAEQSQEIQTVSVSELSGNMYLYLDEVIQVKGVCCYTSAMCDIHTFNLEDSEDSVSCIADLTDVTEVMHEGMSFEKSEIASIISSIKRGDQLLVRGTVCESENGSPEIAVSYIEGEDFILYCR